MEYAYIIWGLVLLTALSWMVGLVGGFLSYESQKFFDAFMALSVFFSGVTLITMYVIAFWL